MGARGIGARPQPRIQRTTDKISEEMVGLFRRYLETFPVHLACARDDDHCRKEPGHTGHCDTCKEALAVTDKLRQLIRPYNWDTSGTGADQESWPHYITTPRQRKEWDRAWALRQQLRDAVAERATPKEMQHIKNLWSGLKREDA